MTRRLSDVSGRTASETGRSSFPAYAQWTAALTPEELAITRKSIIEREYPKGSYICHRGDQLDYWTGVITGLVKVSAISGDGKAMTFIGVRAGGWFGEGSVLKNPASMMSWRSAIASSLS